MFIDLEMVDKWFEIGYQDGCLIQFNVFNKRVLLSRAGRRNRQHGTGRNLYP